MVIERLTLWLINLAASRWSNSDEMAREWRGELYELASQQRRGRMLRFALSLTVARPAYPAPFTVRMLVPLLLPVSAVAFWIISPVFVAFASEDIWYPVLGEVAFRLEDYIRYGLMLAAAIGLAMLSRKPASRTHFPSPFVLAMLVVTPMVPLLVWAAALGNMWRLERAMPELYLWPTAMVITLWAAGLLARAGKLWLAWTAGLLGSYTAAALSLMSVMAHLTVPVDTSRSWLWPVDYFLYRAGTDLYAVSPTPEFYLMVTPYAVAYVITAMRHQAPQIGQSGTTQAAPSVQ